MTRARSIISAVTCAGLLVLGLAATIHGQIRELPESSLLPRIQNHVADFDTLIRRPTIPVRNGRIDARTGHHRAAYRMRPFGRTIPDADTGVRLVLERETGRFGWTDPVRNLVLQREIQTPGGVHRLYHQIFSGLPVYGAGVRINLDQRFQPTLITSGFFSHLEDYKDIFSPLPEVTANQARTIVLTSVLAEPAASSDPELVVYPTDPPRLAWLITAWPQETVAEWRVLLDARTGEIIRIHNTAIGRRANGELSTSDSHSSPGESGHAQVTASASGSGYAFNPDPLTTAGVLYGGEYVNGDGRDSPALNDEREAVELPDISLENGRYVLKGPFVEIVNKTQAGTFEDFVPPSEASPDSFFYSRSMPAFRAVNAYHHIDASVRYIESLGYSYASEPVQVNPTYPESDQSFYIPNRNLILYGTGGVPDAEDADVILHEFGHARLDAVVPGLISGGYDEGRSIHEGWGDYWAASYRRHLIDAGVVPPHDWERLFRWDSGWDGERGLYWGGRLLGHVGTYPDDLMCPSDPSAQCVYEDGLLLAATLMEIYDQVGRPVSDALNLQAHHYLSSGSDMRDYAEALIQADQDLFEGSHFDLLVTTLADRGFVDGAPPGLWHSPIARASLDGWPVRISAEVTDVEDIDSVWVSYSIISESANSEMIEGSFRLEPFGSTGFSSVIPTPASAIEPGDQLRYRIYARDTALHGNKAGLPAVSGAFFSVVIDGEGVIDYLDFENPHPHVETTGLWRRDRPAYGLLTPRSGNRAAGIAPDEPYPRMPSVSTLDLPIMRLPRGKAAYLLFWEWHDTPLVSGNEQQTIVADGGYIRFSYDGGNTWEHVVTDQGYPAVLQAADSETSEEVPVFGGMGYGWQRHVVQLPDRDSVKIRFVFEVTESGADEEYAGWHIDDVMFTTAFPADSAPPVFVDKPESVVTAIPGTLPPELIVTLEDETGISRVDVHYEIYGVGDQMQHSADTHRLTMDSADVFRFRGTLPVDHRFLTAGSKIEYRFVAEDFDGNFSTFPPAGDSPLVIRYHRTAATNLLRNVRMTGLWANHEEYLGVLNVEDHAPGPSSLVMEPIDLPHNAAEARFELRHRYHLEAGAGGNVKISSDGGTTWTVLEPENGYPAVLEQDNHRWMENQPVFGGLPGVDDFKYSNFDLITYSGEQIRLRVDFGTNRSLESAENWLIEEAVLHLTTTDDNFDIRRRLSFHEAYPNPFSERTTVGYTLPEVTFVKLELFDVMGRKVETLISEERAEGTHTQFVTGADLSSGLYFLRLTAGGEFLTQKITVVR